MPLFPELKRGGEQIDLYDFEALHGELQSSQACVMRLIRKKIGKQHVIIVKRQPKFFL